ncbi:MAG: 3-methylornithyl-N6-L-lysine dehydrogenase PylD [Synergistaceae bacterium]|jgi:pyrrolysine biosynthesis protein PylD|nr:3-methylornithyl-N6-L-lysine dehydrogenase PylD [Synergistaceae bacterium]
MTRLAEVDIAELTGRLAEYDLYLKEVCGRNLAEIALAAAKKTRRPVTSRVVAVVPVTSGLGIIHGFCETVAAIVEFLGYPAHVTHETDFAGVAEAMRERYDIIMAADDSTFIAVNPQKQLVSDNSEATGRGFATALSLASGGLLRKNVLLLGAGPVGHAAARSMLREGAVLTVFDIDPLKAAALQRQHPSVRIAESMEDALSEHSLLFDATPAGGFIHKGMLRADAILSAPGVPLCLDQECETWMHGRLLHDVLELGVATMLFDAL